MARTLSDEDVQAIAEALADRLREPALRLLTTADTARMLAVSEDYVRDHAAELGAVRSVVASAGNCASTPGGCARRSTAGGSNRRAWSPRRRPGPARSAASVDLLPLPEGH